MGHSLNYLSSAELYDPAFNAWTTLSSMNTARTSHTATILPNGKVFVAGGFHGSCLDSAEVYDPSFNTWTTLSSMKTARRFHTQTTLPNGKVLVTGGSQITNVVSSIDLNSAELYDPSLNAWATVASMSTARESHTATLLLNGKVLVAGGVNDNFLQRC